jgi:hypothetical protein
MVNSIATHQVKRYGAHKCRHGLLCCMGAAIMPTCETTSAPRPLRWRREVVILFAPFSSE